MPKLSASIFYYISSNTCEKIARVSKAKKFSLVYQELGIDARSSVDWSLSTDELLESVALSDATLSLTCEDSLPDDIRDGSISGSITMDSLSSLPNRLEGKKNVFGPILQYPSGALRVNDKPCLRVFASFMRVSYSQFLAPRSFSTGCRAIFLSFRRFNIDVAT
jgi:hypothetical protein